MERWVEGALVYHQVLAERVKTSSPTLGIQTFFNAFVFSILCESAKNNKLAGTPLGAKFVANATPTGIIVNGTRDMGHEEEETEKR